MVQISKCNVASQWRLLIMLSVLIVLSCLYVSVNVYPTSRFNWSYSAWSVKRQGKNQSVTTDKSDDVTTDKSDDVRTEKSDDVTAEKSDDATAGKSDDVTTEKSDDVATEKSDDVTAEKSNDVTAEKSNHVTAEKSDDVTAEKSNDVTAEKSNDVMAEKSDDVAAEKSDDVTAEKSNDVTAEKSNDVTAEKSDDVAAEKSDDVTAEKSDEVTAEKSNDVTAEKSNDVTAEKSDDVTAEKSDNDRLRIALENATEKKTLIIWDIGFRDEYMLKNPDRKLCGNCELTFDKSKISNPESKAVLFYFESLHSIPKERRQDQYWVFWSREGPPASRRLRGLTFDGFDNFFNLTMMFRRDADIYDPYGHAADILAHIIATRAPDQTEAARIDAIVAGKRSLALWVVSNCGATDGARRRIRFADSLVAAGLRLERRGACYGGRAAPYDKLDKYSKHRDAIKPFKFYLSFENSFHCRDYITEKLFTNTLLSDAVPVAFGATREDYDAVLPPNSYIFAEDFATPKALVEYLDYLDRNDSAYKEYFRWRTMDVREMPMYGRETAFCQLCRVVHGINADNEFNPEREAKYRDVPAFGFAEKPRVVASVKEFYYKGESKECLPSY